MFRYIGYFDGLQFGYIVSWQIYYYFDMDVVGFDCLGYVVFVSRENELVWNGMNGFMGGREEVF